MAPLFWSCRSLRPSTARWSVQSASLLLALSLVGCSRPAPPPEPVRAVKLVTAVPAGAGEAPVFAGDVRAQVESRLGFRVGGKILKRQAEVGQRVAAGQVLAQLDPQDLRLAADAARAQVASARTSRDLAAADFQRYAALKAQNFISAAELERREAQVRSAQAALDQAQAQLAAQGNQAAYASLVADAPGVVTAIEAEAGQVVAAGTPVVRVAVDGVRDAVFAVPEDQVRRFTAGQPVAVRTWGTEVALQGRVREVGAAADPATRTFTVKVALEGAAPPLGTTVSVQPQAVGTAPAAGVRLPTSALRRDGDATTVWLLDEPTMTVRAQPVAVGGIEGSDVVMTRGVQPGQRVVAAGVHVLAPGQKVTIYEGKYPFAQDPPAQGAMKSVAGASASAATAPTSAAAPAPATGR